jgi:hypothetical protein
MKALANIALGAVIFMGSTFVIFAILFLGGLEELSRLGEQVRSRK